MVATALAAAATIGGSLFASKSAKKSAKAQTDASAAATAEQRRQFDLSFGLQKPIFEAGDTARNQLLNALGLGEAGAQEAFFADFENDPGFRATQEAGIEAIDRSASARGTLGSGGTQKDLFSFGQRQLNDQFTNRLNRLTSLAGAGQTASSNAGTLATNLGTSVGNNLITAGNAQAGGIINQSNALTSGVNNFNTLLGRNSGKINSFFGTA